MMVVNVKPCTLDLHERYTVGYGLKVRTSTANCFNIFYFNLEFLIRVQNYQTPPTEIYLITSYTRETLDIMPAEVYSIPFTNEARNNDSASIFV